MTALRLGGLHRGHRGRLPESLCATTRRFDEGRAYRKHARLHDCCALGDDRVIYAKRLMDPHQTDLGSRGYE